MNNNNNKEYFLRWTRVERWQHWILAISFSILAITGFALKYPDAPWLRPFLVFEEYFGFRGWLHRAAALVFTGLSFFHAGYLFFSARGRSQLKALSPTRQDFRDFWQNMQFLRGKRHTPPEFDRFSYMEKLEYWALVWGTIVMAVTGFLLWFETFALRVFPLWMLEVFTVIHLYEAWLATLAIFVWHFYWVIFNPEVYPLNQSMVDGMMSEREMEREHGRELARLRQQEESESTEMISNLANKESMG